MKLTPVESSHVAAIGYLEDERVLLVRYRDGALYAVPGMPLSVWEACQTAESKGRYLARLRGAMILLTKGGAEQESQSMRADLSARESGPLNTIDENAGKCCRKLFLSQDRNGEDRSFSCADCGTEFRPEMVGPVRHWRIVEHFAVHRPGGR
jgi:hypothetical protein